MMFSQIPRNRVILAAMKEVTTSKEFACSAGEVAVIEKLSSLPTSLIFNDVKMESGRYIHFQGKVPLLWQNGRRRRGRFLSCRLQWTRRSDPTSTPISCREMQGRLATESQNPTLASA